MSALGQKQTSHQVRVMSALPAKADIAGRDWDVRFGPIGDIRSAATVQQKLGDSGRPGVSEAASLLKCSCVLKISPLSRAR